MFCCYSHFSNVSYSISKEFLIPEFEQWLHRLSSGQQGEVSSALWQLPAAGVHHAEHSQQSQIWTKIRTRYNLPTQFKSYHPNTPFCFRNQHVHLPQVRSATGNASGCGGGGGALCPYPGWWPGRGSMVSPQGDHPPLATCRSPVGHLQVTFRSPLGHL